MTDFVKEIYQFKNDEAVKRFIGSKENIIKLITKKMRLEYEIAGASLIVKGSLKSNQLFRKVYLEITRILTEKGVISKNEVKGIIKSVTSTGILNTKVSNITAKKNKYIKPKSQNQLEFLEAIDLNTVVFAIGAAGTGKTILTVAKAVEYLLNKQVERIVITRPVVESGGEKLGFLPGDLKEKIDPYLRPIYDYLYEIIGVKETEEYIRNKVIEISPLAYMRGRNINNAFVIADEMQNSNGEQMKMLLTRIGENSKLVVNGDRTQSDLPRHVKSGLIMAEIILKNVKDVKFIYLHTQDIQRSEIVKNIVTAYEEYELSNIVKTEEKEI